MDDSPPRVPAIGPGTAGSDEVRGKRDPGHRLSRFFREHRLLAIAAIDHTAE